MVLSFSIDFFSLQNNLKNKITLFILLPYIPFQKMQKLKTYTSHKRSRSVGQSFGLCIVTPNTFLSLKTTSSGQSLQNRSKFVNHVQIKCTHYLYLQLIGCHASKMPLPILSASFDVTCSSTPSIGKLNQNFSSIQRDLPS